MGLGRGRVGFLPPSQSHSSCLVATPSSFSPDIFSSVSVPPSLKVCLDLSAEYLILSDVQRKVGCSGDTLGRADIIRGDKGVCGTSTSSQPLSSAVNSLPVQVLYVMELLQNQEEGRACFSSISEFLLTHPVLSFGIQVVSRCRLRHTEVLPAEEENDSLGAGELLRVRDVCWDVGEC